MHSGSNAMPARSIATLSLSFGLVSIPVKLYSATESSAAIRFRLMSPGGARVRQQYVSDESPPAAEPPESEVEVEEAAPEPPAPKARSGAASRVVDFPASRAGVTLSSPRIPAPSSPSPRSPPPDPAPAVIERSEMVKGYEFEKGRFVLFTAAELKALAEASRQTIDIVEFIPERAIDPIYFDKAYFLAPDKRGAKPYSLLLRAMQDTGRSALAKWAFRAKEYVVQIRAAQGGMVLQQLLYADEVRSLDDLDIDLAPVGAAELQLAKQLIEQISAEAYDPARFVDEEKQRILAAVERKIEGRQIVAPAHRDAPIGAQVVDLVAALRASLQAKPPPAAAKAATPSGAKPAADERKPVKRAAARDKDPASTKRPAGKR
jgi:DNA end-binding protein Ku